MKRPTMQPERPPISTYRLQFNRDFTFADATAIVDYLHRLGVSHIYASPYLKARAGSPHGYDIVDHSALNPEIGDEAAFEELVQALHRRGMGQILDVVPNHMGVGGCDNAWWLDVLENGEASAHAGYFDIDWRPADPALRDKLLLPFLGDHYGQVLERGEIGLVFDETQDGFHAAYYEHCFPLDPRSYPAILEPAAVEVERTDASLAQALSAASAVFAALPARTGNGEEQRARRRREVPAAKRRLAALCADHPALTALLRRHAASFQGRPGEARSFDRLHCLLEAQAYRLAYWQVATDQINYRRFFDINDLAGLRMERPEVFRDTHRLIERLLRTGRVDGLRIDHPDGLNDPHRYFRDLQRLAGGRPLYLAVEKILAGYERLPADWPVAGTTGYDYAALLNGLFVWPGSERRLNRLYRRFTGLGTDFDELLYERKKLIIRSTLSGELSVLGNLLHRIAQADRHTRDFTYHGLLHAITETVACFPVYRTYVTAATIGAEDRRYVQWAIAKAKKRSPAADIVIFDFLRDALLLERCARYQPEARAEVLQFALRFQQYTAPVMAKGMEDTSFYIYNRLVSLNDVGFDPRVWAVSPAAFHHQNRQRLADWPLAMICTSTHDSKRSEDVRARIDAISEAPEDWQRHLGRWARINRARKLIVDDKYAPSRNDEYLLYQTLVGVWPLEPVTPEALDALRERIEAYMLKAAREAKVHTSWINPNEAYEEALAHFIRALLHDTERNAFLADFVPFQQTLARYGLLSALSQTVLKLASPGVPDIYQGNELWTFDLVDPDNRRPVDYRRRAELLDSLIAQTDGAPDLPALMRGLLDKLEDGCAKLYVTWRVLGVRNAYPEIFHDGDYAGLEAHGARAEHVCAFARSFDGRHAIAAAGRWFARLALDRAGDPLGEACWQDTWIEAPAPGPYRDVFSGATVVAVEYEGRPGLRAAEMFSCLPVALLVNG